jgi:hypothetical protein
MLHVLQLLLFFFSSNILQPHTTFTRARRIPRPLYSLSPPLQAITFGSTPASNTQSTLMASTTLFVKFRSCSLLTAASAQVNSGIQYGFDHTTSLLHSMVHWSVDLLFVSQELLLDQVTSCMLLVKSFSSTKCCDGSVGGSKKTFDFRTSHQKSSLIFVLPVIFPRYLGLSVMFYCAASADVHPSLLLLP